MTADTLKSYTLKDLVKIAKQRGVNGWQSMRKDQLVKALVKVSKASATSRNGKAKAVPLQRSARTASSRTTSARAVSTHGRSTSRTTAVVDVEPSGACEWCSHLRLSRGD